MARQELVRNVSLPAGADLSADQFTFVALNGSGQVVRASATTDRVIGVLQNNPSAVGRAAEVALVTQSILKVRSGEAVAIGGIVKTDATGRATDAAIATTEIEIGIALTASAAADELVEVLCGVGVRGGIA